MDVPGLREQILANAKQVMLHQTQTQHPATAARRAKNHELLVREDGHSYRAVIIGDGKLRLEGAAAETPKAALEALFARTAQMLEEASEAWEADGYAGEEIVTLGDGARVAREIVVVEAEAEVEVGAGGGADEVEVAMGDGDGDGEEVVVDGVDAKAEAAAMGKKQGRPKFVYTGKRGRPRKSVAAGALGGDAGEEAKPKRPRGRPRKDAA
ncbi:hypothetical protein LTR36_005326 [Oleoguttula mirabilis]|uniref:Uncharacterized protein n=1 Tax=Oleoguttula mirabilis TaxID=1507867 RepID=A0AAV9JFX9_9PEZI|nr:hypothetical protein LTR36_005326 [Oleoguttula mirabilis]